MDKELSFCTFNPFLNKANTDYDKKFEDSDYNTRLEMWNNKKKESILYFK